MAVGAGVSSGIDSLLNFLYAQWEKTGNLPQVQNASQKIKEILNANKDKDFIKRILNPKLNKGREVQIAGEPEKLSHYMMQVDNLVIPQVVDKGEKVKGKSMLSFLTEQDAYDYALRTGEYIQLPSEQDALWFSKNYKQYWGEGY